MLIVLLLFSRHHFGLRRKKDWACIPAPSSILSGTVILYDGVGGFSRTNADFIMFYFYQYLNNEDYVVYVPYGPEIEPSEDRHGEFLEIKYVGIDMNLPDSGRRYRKIVVFYLEYLIFFFSFA